MLNKGLSFCKGKRNILFCADSNGVESLNPLVVQAVKEEVPYDFHMIEEEPDTFLYQWFSQQKMGSYLYISGNRDFVKRVEKLALESGFFEYEMQINIIGEINKRVICCECHGCNVVVEKEQFHCKHCGLELEVSNHYSRRLDAYLGYHSIK